MSPAKSHKDGAPRPTYSDNLKSVVGLNRPENLGGYFI